MELVNRFTGRFKIMHTITLSGTYFEMGVQLGENLKKSGFNPEFIIPKNYTGYEFLAECEAAIAEHTPGIIKNLKGIAKGGDYDYERLKILPMSLFFDSPKMNLPSCTVFAIKGEYTESKKPIFVRNYDWDISFQSLLTVTHSALTQGIPNVGFGDTYGTRYGGTNANGLTIAITSGGSYGGIPKPGITMCLATRWMLDQLSTTEEAVNFLEKIPHVHGFNYMICDADGSIARIATTPERVEVDYANDGVLIQTNHYINPKMQKIENESLIPVSSKIRYQNVQDWIKSHKNPISVADIRDLTSLDVEKNGICDHGEFEGIKFGTIWSWIFDYDAKQLSLSPGPPCKMEYERIKLAV